MPTLRHIEPPYGNTRPRDQSKEWQVCIVRINDCGPFIEERIMDVTIGVARHLGMTNAGADP